MYVEQVQGSARIAFESADGNKTTIMQFDRTGNAMSEETFEQALEPTARRESEEDEVRRGHAHVREDSAPKEELVLVDLGEEEDMMLESEEDDEDKYKAENPWSDGGTDSHMHLRSS
jgi:hypothetical protein